MYTNYPIWRDESSAPKNCRICGFNKARQGYRNHELSYFKINKRIEEWTLLGLLKVGKIIREGKLFDFEMKKSAKKIEISKIFPKSDSAILYKK